MRTNITLDDELVRQAFGFSSAKTKRELIDQALREFVQRHKTKDLLDLAGAVEFVDDYDHKRLRELRNVPD
jgi:Arc/MetJ family transcription regulator